MKKTFFLGIMTTVFSFQPAIAKINESQLQDRNSIKNFLGEYDLVSNQDTSGSFCYRGVLITEEKENIHLYRADMKDEGSVTSAKLNGSERASTGSHGEAMTTTKYRDKVSLANGTLVFKTTSAVKFMGIPAGSESDTYTFSLSSKLGGLNATRKVRENLKTSTAACVYQKIN